MDNNTGNTNNNNIDWTDTIKKEARGRTDDDDLGEVQAIGDTHILTEKGLLDKVYFYIPKELAEDYDGHTLRFRITEDEAKSNFLMDKPPTIQGYSLSTFPEFSESGEIVIPVIGQNLEVSKTVTEDEAKIIKEPVKETKTTEMQLTHEELTIEIRPVHSPIAGTGPGSETPIVSPNINTEVKIPLNYEEPVIQKTPYVKEEIVIRKKPITETKTLSEEIISESVDIEGYPGQQQIQ